MPALFLKISNLQIFFKTFNCKCRAATLRNCRICTFVKNFKMVASACSLISCSENYILHFFFLFFSKGEEVSELVFLMLLQTINIFVILKSFCISA